MRMKLGDWMGSALGAWAGGAGLNGISWSRGIGVE